MQSLNPQSNDERLLNEDADYKLKVEEIRQRHKNSMMAIQKMTIKADILVAIQTKRLSRAEKERSVRETTSLRTAAYRKSSALA